MRVAILDDYFDTLRTLDCFSLLDGHEVTVFTDHTDDDDDLALRLVDSEAVVLIRERTAMRTALLERLPALRLISLRSVYPHVDVETCTRLGVVVSSDLHQDTPSYATAELAFTLILAGLRELPRQISSMTSGHWQSGVGRTARAKTLGLYGYGRIARVVAGYAEAFGMDVVVFASDASRARAREDGRRVAATREEFFSSCDVVSLHLRLVPDTRGIVTARDLALMKPTSLLVNTSRAGLVEPGALLRALRAGRPGFAALDVFDVEPLTDVTDPLLSMDNVICTPHVGYVTREEWELQFRDVFGQVASFASGEPINVINPEVLSHRR